MRYSFVIATSIFLNIASGHGVVSSIQGANGVNMPGLSIRDGTPRNCDTPSCGAEQDTSIIRDDELGSSKATALGRTNGQGPVDASVMMANFMGGVPAPSNPSNKLRRGLSSLLGGGSSTSGSSSTGTKADTGVESSVAQSLGQGATSGLPTCSDDGSVTLTYRQINQDGAGPLTADVDATSGGTDPSAFQTAQVTQDVPGLGIGGLSAATQTEFPVAVQMPAGMTCSGTVGNATNVCIVRVRNNALAGPFGGSAAFTMSSAAHKRAIEYQMMKRAEEEGSFQARRLA
ncbi:cell surface protein [Xylariaceae sp. FL0255]|nr:cell surface protein [Xylariaceae sp. FL0255]